MAVFDFVRRALHSLSKKAGTSRRGRIAIKAKYTVIYMRS